MPNYLENKCCKYGGKKICMLLKRTAASVFLLFVKSKFGVTAETAVTAETGTLLRIRSLTWKQDH